MAFREYDFPCEDARYDMDGYGSYFDFRASRRAEFNER